MWNWGTDQSLTWDEICNDFGQKPQFGVLMPILLGRDGVQKMRSPWTICRSSRRPANDVFKLEKIPDHLLEKYFELLTDLSLFELPEQPRDRQKLLGLILLPSTTVGSRSLLSKQRCH